MTQNNGLLVDEDGNRFWYENGQLHRTDGPAIEHASGTRRWYLNGQRHRVDGPAVEWANGSCEWYLNSQRITFAKWIEQLNCSDRERLVFVLKYSHKELST
jgi:hypothetical protein